MKPITSILLAVVFSFTLVFGVNAQSAETIWLTASTTNFKTGETVVVTVNAVSGTPVQGLTFQIRYDPACLQPTGATSPIPGMNGLSLPQTPGLVDATFASTSPQIINGILADVRFLTLGGCQTNLVLESAALAIRNQEGFAAPLAGVTVGEKNIVLNVDKELGTSQSPDPVSGGTPLPLGLPLTPSNERGLPFWLIILFLAVVSMVGVIIAIGVLRKPSRGNPQKNSTPFKPFTLSIKQGPMAGKIFQVTKLPCRIGSSPVNDICLNDPKITDKHAQIFLNNDNYYLMDLGGETFVNEKMIKKSTTLLKPGDKVRLGQGVLFVFGY
jgi:hypothetical protein